MIEFSVKLASRTGGPVKTKTYKASSAEEAERMARKEFGGNTTRKVISGETMEVKSSKLDSAIAACDSVCAKLDAAETAKEIKKRFLK